MGEDLRGVMGAHPGCWDLRDRALGWYKEVCVHQGVVHVCQCFQKHAEKLGGLYPPHWQDQVDADDFYLILWCRWDDIRKLSHFAAMVRVCDVEF